MRTLMASLFPCPTADKPVHLFWWACLLSPCLGRASHQLWFPCADEQRGGGLSSTEGCLLALTRQLRSQAASFPTVAKEPKTISC